MEVLISTFVIAVGLLGLAALLPIGRMTITETIIADRSADCGRAALHEVKVRRLLDQQFWVPAPPSGGTWGTSDAMGRFIPNDFTGSVILDPLAYCDLDGQQDRPAAELAPALGKALAALIPHVSLNYVGQGKVAAGTIFASQDDKIFTLPEDQRPTDGTPYLPAGRPLLTKQVSGGWVLDCNAHYTWFATITRLPGSRQSIVSTVVCNQREFTDPQTAQVAQFLDQGLAGGSIVLEDNKSIKVRPNDWIALCGMPPPPSNPNPNVFPFPLCQWYRVVAIGEPMTVGGTTRQMLTLAGPDWPISVAAVAVAIGKGVAGVYKTTMELDTDPLWNK